MSGADISSDGHDTFSIALGDVDGDGDLDLVAGNSGQANRLYLNNGTAPPFSAVTGSDISSDGHDTYSIALGDVDGDGDLDLVAGNCGQANRLYLNNGTAPPFSAVTGADISSDGHDTYSIALGDVDGDGDLDLVAGNSGQTNRLYLNNGTASPFSAVSGSDISSDAHNTYSIALGDVDRDGDLDLVAGNDAQTNRLYLNDGTAAPFGVVTGTDISSDAHNTYSIALGDVDRDGDLDLVAGNDAQTNRLYLNDGMSDPFNGVSGTDISSDAHNTVYITLGDVDGDGDLDLAAGNDAQTNRLYLNNGMSNPFRAETKADISSDGHDNYSIALGDVDGDGDLDLAAGNRNYANCLYLNNGTSNPFNGVTCSDISSDAPDTFSIALGDVDGDGDLDLAAGNPGQTNRLYLNNGTANPFNGVSGSDISSDAHLTWTITLGDVDGDGDLDLVAGNYNQTNRLYLNDGTAAPFSGVSGTDISSDEHSTQSIALGDVDGDGDLDLVAGNRGGSNRLYLNNGTAAPFSSVTGSDISSDVHYTTYSIVLGDVDGDGDLDLVAGNSIGYTNRLYLNNGTAAPFSGVTGSDISSDAHRTDTIKLGDMDGDGDLDLVVGNRGGTNRLYMNDGTASPFSAVTGSDISGDAHYTQSIALGDVDGDGNLDLVEGNDGRNRLYLHRINYNAAHGLGTSLRVDTESVNITVATLTASADLPTNTRVTYYLSNNGGARWYIVQPGEEFNFPSIGMDLRWKAELSSLSPVRTPKINQIQIIRSKISLSNSSVAENQLVNSVVGDFSTTDLDTGSTFTYKLAGGTGDTDNALFNISGESLRTSGVFDYETRKSYSIRVRITDQDSLYFEKAFTITVTNDNEAPTDISLSNSSVAENHLIDTAVGVFTSADPDTGDTYTYTLAAGGGDADNASFKISGDSLRTSHAFDYETRSRYSIRVRSVDQGGLYVEKAFTITVFEEEEGPVCLPMIFK